MGMNTPGDVLEQEPQDIAARAEEVGGERLDRTNLEILLTAIIGGGEVSLGGLAAVSWVGNMIGLWRHGGLAVPPFGVFVSALLAGGLAVTLTC